MITVNQLHPLFFGEIVGADLTAEPTEDLRQTVQDAMDRHGVCVVRQGPITDEEHIRFARLFGHLALDCKDEQVGHHDRGGKEVKRRKQPIAIGDHSAR